MGPFQSVTASPHLEPDLEVGVLLMSAGLCSHPGSKEGWTGLCHSQRGALLQPGLKSSSGTSRDRSQGPLSELKGREAEQWPGGRGVETAMGTYPHGQQLGQLCLTTEVLGLVGF